MFLDVKVIPNAKQEKVERQEDGSLKVWVREKPLDGKATQATRRAIANYLGVGISNVNIKQTASRKKKVELT